MNTNQEYEDNKKKLHLSIAAGITATVVFIALILIVCTYTEAISFFGKTVIIIIGLLIFIAGLYMAMEGERTTGFYKCKNCNELYIPGRGAYLMGAHIGTTRYLKCPVCGKRTWCKKVLSNK